MIEQVHRLLDVLIVVARASNCLGLPFCRRQGLSGECQIICQLSRERTDLLTVPTHPLEIAPNVSDLAAMNNVVPHQDANAIGH